MQAASIIFRVRPAHLLAVTERRRESNCRARTTPITKDAIEVALIILLTLLLSGAAAQWAIKLIELLNLLIGGTILLSVSQ